LSLGGKERNLQSFYQGLYLCHWSGEQQPAWVTRVFCWQLLANLTQSALWWFVPLFLTYAEWLACSLLSGQSTENPGFLLPEQAGMNSPAQTVFNLWWLDEVSHLALHCCVFLAVCLPDILSAAAASSGADGEGSWRNRGEMLVSAWVVPSLPVPADPPFGPRLAAAALLPLGSPRWEGGKISSPCILCQGCVVD
jgi:hypothetical protein